MELGKMRQCNTKWLPTVILLVTILHNHWLMVDSAGCIFLRDDQSIRCQNTSLQDIGESLHILTVVVNNKPQVIDIEDCGGTTELTPIFNRINATIDTVRIRRSGIHVLHMDTFIPIANNLRDLDLSHNALRTVPEALMVLWSLEHLNLQHNRIVFVRPGSIFDGLPSLRELNFANNYIGQADDIADVLTEQHGYQLKGTLGLEDFSLGKALRSLESLNLRGNRLVSAPVQVSNYSLPELRHLDLSENVISKVDELSSALLPKLEFLDFHSNRLQSIPFYSLPITLQYLDLTENPYHCDCGALWLYDWYSTNTTTIRLPACNSPSTYKGTDLDKIPWASHCPDDNATFSFRYMAKGFRDYDVIQLVSSATVINVSWKVKLNKERDGKKWTVVYRKANDSPYQMTLSSSPPRNGKSSNFQEAVLSERIQNLQPSTIYIVCVAVIQEGKYTIEPNKCQKVQTKSYKEVGEFEGKVDLDSLSKALFTPSNIRTVLEDISVSAEAITIKWKLSMLDPLGESKESRSVRHEWTLRIRRTGSDNYTDIPVFDITRDSETNHQLYEYSISDLASRTHYDICLVDVDHQLLNEKSPPIVQKRSYRLQDNETTICRIVVTSGNYALYATEIGAIAVACAICLIVIVVTIYLCRQKRLLNWKPKKLREWLAKTLGRNERPPPIGSSGKYATATIPRVRCEPRSSHRIVDKTTVGTWNTLRMPYKDFPQIESDLDGPTSKSYKDALSSVTIYKSGHSEC